MSTLERVAAVLKNVPVLKQLTDGDRVKLAGLVVTQSFPVGSNIITQGDASNGFYIIITGEASVLRRATESDAEVEIGRLNPGDYFGEAGLIGNAPRGATVKVVKGPAECLYLDQANFFSVFSKERLNVQFAKRQAVSSGLTRSAPKIPKDAVRTKTPAQHNLVMRAVQDNVLFMGMDAAHKDSVIREMYRWTFRSGENAIVQGDLGDNLYVVETGEFHVFVHGRKVATRGRGTLFGELALLYNSPRAATVTAVSDAVVWVIDRFTFRRVVTDLSERKYKAYVSFLQKVPLLQPLAEYERAKIAEALDEVFVRAGQLIFRQDSVGDCMYLVFEGELTVSKLAPNATEAVHVNVIKPGGYFGERALLNKELRAATVTTQTDCRLLKLDRNAFSLLLGPLEDIMKAKIQEDNQVESSVRTHSLDATAAKAKIESDRQQQQQAAAAAAAADSTAAGGSQSAQSQAQALQAAAGSSAEDERKSAILAAAATGAGAGAGGAAAVTNAGPVGTVSPGFAGVPMDSLKVLGTLGRGSFGYVQLVQDRRTQQTYALKAVSKAQIAASGQQSHILSEKRVMMSLQHPFLVRLWQTYRDQHRLYFLLDAVLGGELFTLLRHRSLFDEGTARFYAASVVLAFESMHARGIIYRDLKPENLLLDAAGYVKVTDFGFAKEVGDGRTFTLCGTPDYLAPEIVAGAGHGMGVDWWTVGIFVFEMLASYPPFYDEDPMRTYSKIMDGVIQFPAHFSKEALSLIKKYVPFSMMLVNYCKFRLFDTYCGFCFL